MHIITSCYLPFLITDSSSLQDRTDDIRQLQHDDINNYLNHFATTKLQIKWEYPDWLTLDLQTCLEHWKTQLLSPSFHIFKKEGRDR